MDLQYRVTEIDDTYLQRTIMDIRNRYEKLLEICRNYSKDVAFSLTPVEDIDPVTNDIKEYKFPLVKHVEVMYHFVTCSKHDLPVEEAVAKIDQIYTENIFLNDLDYKINTIRFYNTRIGFLYYMADLKLRLLTGDDFSAHEVGVMMGVTGQAITNRIKRGSPKVRAEKKSNRYVISNSEARRIITESDSPLLKEGDDRQLSFDNPGEVSVEKTG